MTTALLVEYYQSLPQPRPGDDPDAWAARMRPALDAYRRQVEARYGEGTLQRLLEAPTAEVRRAAALALGLMGSMAVNATLAAALHDDDPGVRRQAADALWAVWSRAGGEAPERELQRLVRMRDPGRALAGLDALVRQVPDYAEAVNQRAIVHFRQGAYAKAVVDCERVLQMNPYHFGAAAGLARCYLKLHKPRAALEAFRTALRLNPDLTEVERAVRDLEDVLGEEGTRDDCG